MTTMDTTLVAPEIVAGTILTSLVNARKRGDPWTTVAEEYLGQTEALLKRIGTLRINNFAKFAHTQKTFDEMNRQVLVALEHLADEIWEQGGPTKTDSLLSILTAGTPSYLFDWSIGQPSDRIEVLVELLKGSSSVPAGSVEVAAALRNLLPEYRTVCVKLQHLRSKAEILEKMAESFARVGHVQYTRVRRRMRADGFDAFEVRKVFPDIPGQSVMGTLG